MKKTTKLHAVRHFAVYYGMGQSSLLGKFDVAVVEPLGMRKEDLSHLQQNGTLVVSYLSVLEVHPSQPIFHQLMRSDFLTVGGSIVKNEMFGTWLVDPRSPRWRNLLLKQAEQLLGQANYDGLFLDTIGDVERADIPELMQRALIHECTVLLQEIKQRYPNRILIQNNGLERLICETAPLLDAICWESPPFASKGDAEWTKMITGRLARLKSECGLRVLLLFEESTITDEEQYRMARKIAQRYGFLLYRAPEQYVAGIGDAELMGNQIAWYKRVRGMLKKE